MRAMCPHCGGKGCDQPNCVDGYLKVTFAEGDWWTRQCPNLEDCGYTNGGRICEGFPPESSGPCVVCKGPTDWVSMNEIPDNAMDGYIKNYEKFANKSNDEMIEKLRNWNLEILKFVQSWPETKTRSLTKEECKLLQICSVCREPSNPSEEKGGFVYASWSHEKCGGKGLGPSLIYVAPEESK